MTGKPHALIVKGSNPYARIIRPWKVTYLRERATGYDNVGTSHHETHKEAIGAASNWTHHGRAGFTFSRP